MCESPKNFAQTIPVSDPRYPNVAGLWWNLGILSFIRAPDSSRLLTDSLQTKFSLTPSHPALTLAFSLMVCKEILEGQILAFSERWNSLECIEV